MQPIITPCYRPRGRGAGPFLLLALLLAALGGGWLAWSRQQQQRGTPVADKPSPIAAAFDPVEKIRSHRFFKKPPSSADVGKILDFITEPGTLHQAIFLTDMGDMKRTSVFIGVPLEGRTIPIVGGFAKSRAEAVEIFLGSLDIYVGKEDAERRFDRK